MTKPELNQLSYDIIACAITVHDALGPGLLESIYEQCLIHELELKGFKVQQQIKIPISYKQIQLQASIRADLVINESIVVELKTVEEIHPIHRAQTLSYMKLLNCPKGIIINFFCEKITDKAIHLANELFENAKVTLSFSLNLNDLLTNYINNI